MAAWAPEQTGTKAGKTTKASARLDIIRLLKRLENRRDTASIVRDGTKLGQQYFITN